MAKKKTVQVDTAKLVLEGPIHILARNACRPEFISQKQQLKVQIHVKAKEACRPDYLTVEPRMILVNPRAKEAC